jgi:hypothetical protein
MYRREKEPHELRETDIRLAALDAAKIVVAQQHRECLSPRCKGSQWPRPSADCSLREGTSKRPNDEAFRGCHKRPWYPMYGERNPRLKQPRLETFLNASHGVRNRTFGL